MNRLSLVVRILRTPIHRSLREISILQRTPFHRSESRMLFPHAVQRFFNFFILHNDLRMVRAEFLISLYVNLGHDLEAGLELQRLAIVNVQVGHARLRDRNHPELFRLFAEIPRNERLDHIALEIFFKPLPDDSGRNVSCAEPRQPCNLLIFLNERFRFARDFFRRNLDRDLPVHSVFILGIDGLRGTHFVPFSELQLCRIRAGQGAVRA